jgi:hypothetical protein
MCESHYRSLTDARKHFRERYIRRPTVCAYVAAVRTLVATGTRATARKLGQRKRQFFARSQCTHCEGSRERWKRGVHGWKPIDASNLDWQCDIARVICAAIGHCAHVSGLGRNAGT